MKSEFPLDYAVFQLSPRRSRCELFVSYDGTTEKIASGLLKPFVTHLKAAKEQAASSVKSITLEVEDCRSSQTWFTKGTLERFVRFVSNPEVLELVSTFDAEVSQLEAARKIYSQGPGEGSVGDGGATTASDATKKELLRAIDVRLTTVRQDLSAAYAHASAAGFNPDTILELQHFANQFGAHRLSESCCNFMSLCQRRPELFPARNSRVHDQAIRSSSVSDSSLNEYKSATMQATNKPGTYTSSSNSRESSIEKEDTKEMSDLDKQKIDDTSIKKADLESSSTGPRPPVRQLSVQERISLFENKQQEKSSSGSGSKPVTGKSVELRRLSSDVSSAGQMGFEKAVLRRWSGAGDITPIKTSTSSIISDDMDGMCSNASATSSMPEAKEIENGSDSKNEGLQNNSGTTNIGGQLTVLSGASEEVCAESKSTSFYGGSESDGWKDQSNFVTQSKGYVDGPKDFYLQNQINSLSVPGNIEQFASRGALSSSEEEATTSFVAQKACDTYEDTADPEDMGSRNKKIPKSRLKTFQKATIDRVSTSDSSVVSQINSLSVPGNIEQFASRGALSSSEEEATTSFVAQKACDTYEDTADPEDMGSRNKKIPKSRLKTFQKATIDRVSTSDSSVVSQNKESESDQMTQKSSTASKGSSSHKMKFQRHSSASAHVKKSRGKRDDSGPGSRIPGVSGKTFSENRETISSISTSMEQNQRMKQSKGNQELNDELKQKANELEKLFAEHKSTVTRGSKPSVDVSTPQPASLKTVAEPSRSSHKKKSTATQQPLGNRDFDDTPKQEMHGLGFSDQNRGKLYSKYTQKRDEKLKEEWSSKRAEKEARMKFLQDSLERSSSEMKSKFAVLNDSQDLYQRSEKLRSFTSRSGVRQKQPIHSFVSDEDEDQAEFVPPALRSVKALASGAGRQKLQQENPLAQSVPNYSEFRKESMTASTSASKGAGNSLVRNYNLSKSSNKDVLSTNGSVNPLESKDFTSLNFEDVESVVDEDYDNMDNNRRPRGSQESVKSVNSGCDNGLPSQSNPSSMAEMPAALPSPFRSMVSVLDSPGESPGSWHSRVHNPYSFQNEISDFDASVDSPIGSPAYWNTNDSDAARMRKKWGATQKNVVSDSSTSHSRKDVSKGLKRFLKFGRKNRGADSLADWVSVTTSEGDDDTEDGKDPAGNKSLEDFRKSRMGFLHYNNDDGFSETDSFSEQVHGFPSSSPIPPMNFKSREDHLSGSPLKAPKSFFSLSTFRSKGSDSKPR